MVYDARVNDRRSIRLKGYDYALPGAYFVTIVTQGRACLLGSIDSGQVQLNQAGLMVEGWWKAIGERFPGVAVDRYVVMPNHFHGIIVIGADKTAGIGADVSLSRIVQWFKTMTTNAYMRGVEAEDWMPFQGRLWQRNYYEHVIRDDVELEWVCAYIEGNPAKWPEDEENPAISS